jgi:tetratricopeptide (TPR) repeat protein
VIDMQSALARQLARAGRNAEARDLYRAAYAAGEGNEMLRAWRDDLLRGMGVCEFHLGNYDEAMRLFEEAIDEAIAVHGKDHPHTLELLGQYAEYALDAGRLDDAIRRYSAALSGFQKRPDTTPLALARLEGDIGVSIALARGRPRDAEALARKSLAVLRAGPGATAADRAAVEDGLAGALVDQRRWSEALQLAEAALADLRASGHHADQIALIQLKRARALYELGHRAEGREIAGAARAMLAASPGQRRASQVAAALVAKLR